MKATFTTKEYARLLELVHLGLLVVNGREGAETPAAQHYTEITQKIFELATPFGCADLVDVGSNGRLVASTKLAEGERLGKIIGEYHNDTFWHELVARMSDRDLATQQTKQALAGAGGPPIDTDLRLRELEDAYWEEFEKNDLANLVLLRGGRG